MTLIGKNVWMLGGVGRVGAELCRGYLRSGARVIVCSRFEERLTHLSHCLGYPDGLFCIKGSLMDDNASSLVFETLAGLGGALDCVVAHNNVKWWSRSADETQRLHGYSSLLNLTSEDFVAQSSHLVSLHFESAKQLIPFLRGNRGKTSYLFLTGLSHRNSYRRPVELLNAYQIRGLVRVLREELRNETSNSVMNVKEIRIEISDKFSLSLDEKSDDQLYHKIGLLCAGIAASSLRADNVERSENSKTGDEFLITDQHHIDSLLRLYPISD